jgi:hypothetical protein
VHVKKLRENEDRKREIPVRFPEVPSGVARVGLGRGTGEKTD